VRPLEVGTLLFQRVKAAWSVECRSAVVWLDILRCRGMVGRA
jgi:hypothetical protein